MTLRFFKAAGTLAVGLVVLAGCDSADPTATASLQEAPTSTSGVAERGLYAITGPSPVVVGTTCRYELEPAVTSGRPGSWTSEDATISATGQYASTNVRWADVTFTFAGTVELTWTSGSAVYTKSITVTPVNGGGVACQSVVEG